MEKSTSYIKEPGNEKPTWVERDKRTAACIYLTRLSEANCRLGLKGPLGTQNNAEEKREERRTQRTAGDIDNTEPDRNSGS